jgi:hypothetical protein
MSRRSEAAIVAPMASMSATDSASLAPRSMTISLLPLSETMTRPTPVDRPAFWLTKRASMPSAFSMAMASLPKPSAPTADPKVARPPRRATAMAWFEPLPPCRSLKFRPGTVSPSVGKRAQEIVMPTA